MGLGLGKGGKRSLVLRPTPRETAWVGDQAISYERSNVPEWARTADRSFLVLEEGKQPAVLHYRGLRDPEMQMLPLPRDGEPFHPLRFREATRYGLLAIDDPDNEIKLRRERDSVGLRRIADEQLEEIDACVARVPWTYTLLALRDAREEVRPTKKGEEPDADDPEAMETLKGRLLDVTLAHWLGVHILAATFRARAHAV